MKCLRGPINSVLCQDNCADSPNDAGALPDGRLKPNTDSNATVPLVWLLAQLRHPVHFEPEPPLQRSAEPRTESCEDLSPGAEGIGIKSMCKNSKRLFFSRVTCFKQANQPPGMTSFLRIF
ncbi:hypothetical protein AV530_018611 [Patagioenas fasciata monilis]|uniref:Uncharacterized protein n=1 Tax=Patagioenas fasciata monilis TaxID=372326 RepID=A0A1V4ID52_PATFA|nr:hypothetical protein AV530_018611 [Patagioenas fasciata monilis]